MYYPWCAPSSLHTFCFSGPSNRRDTAGVGGGHSPWAMAHGWSDGAHSTSSSAPSTPIHRRWAISSMGHILDGPYRRWSIGATRGSSLRTKVMCVPPKSMCSPSSTMRLVWRSAHMHGPDERRVHVVSQTMLACSTVHPEPSLPSSGEIPCSCVHKNRRVTCLFTNEAMSQRRHFHQPTEHMLSLCCLETGVCGG